MHACILSSVDDANNITHTPDTDVTVGTTVVRPNIVWPVSIWKQVRKIAIDKGIPAGQLVVDAVVEHLQLEKAA